MPWLPFPFGPQIPVTPPPDHQSFPLTQGPPPLSPNLLKSFTQQIYGHGDSLLGNSLSGGLSGGLGSGHGGGLKGAGLQGRMMTNQRPMPGSVAAGVNGGAKHLFPPPPPPLQRPQNKQQRLPGIKTEPKEAPATAVPPSTTAPSTSDKTAADRSTTTGAAITETTATTATAAPSEGGPLSASDPRYLAMASRIAAYYHQRCQAVANFQQQRCQAWANMQRQKSQEMTQAAMLVVAWYIRDRIQRRRRREKRQFRRGLAAKAAGNNGAVSKGVKGAGVRRPGVSTSCRVTKGEAVRKWVLQVPEGSAAVSPNTPGARDRPADPDEMSFDIDRDTVSDKDMRLYNVADNLIKSQLARIDVPMMGALSFDASESESDSEDDDDDDDEGDDNNDEGEDDDEPVGPGAHNDEDDIMVNYEERGAPIEAVAVGVEAMITDATATAARAGLGAGAVPRSVNKHTHEAAAAVVDNDADDEEYYLEDDDDYDFEDDDDEEFEEEDYEDDDEDDGQQVSELVHHGTGASSGGSGGRQQMSSFS